MGKEETRYPIGVVTRRTGLKPMRIRAWERRYKVVTPERTEGGQRLYSEADVERLALLGSAVEAGSRIGDIVSMPTDALRALIGSATSQREHDRVRPAGQPGDASSQDLKVLELTARAYEAALKLDADAVSRVLNQAHADLPLARVLEEVVAPLASRVGAEWRAGTLRIAHEHVVSAAARSFLGTMLTLRVADENAPELLVTTPARQRHELGALTIAVTALVEGWRVNYLGCDLPAEEIAGVVSARQPRALALSLTFPVDDPLLPLELSRLRNMVPRHVAIIVGGRAAESYRDALTQIGAQMSANLSAFRDTLWALRRGAPNHT